MKHLKAQIISKFQHTAARRRLAADPIKIAASLMVSTHSRPKAAGPFHYNIFLLHVFQHTAARRRLVALRLAT